MRQRDSTTRAARSVAVDWLRAGCVLYIVGYWHLREYAPALDRPLTPAGSRLTTVVLALFVLLSGLLTGRSATGQTARFYRGRWVRIYPPYALALLLFGVLDLASPSALLRGALLISMFAPPAPPTLWFISLIVLLYVPAPMLAELARWPVRFFSVCSAIELALWMIHLTTGGLDERLLLYFPSFACGVFLAANPERLRRVSLLVLLGLTLAAVPFSYWTPTYSGGMLGRSLPLATLGALSVLTAAMRAERWLPRLGVVAVVAGASYFMYLFHRPLYLGLLSIYSPKSPQQQALYLWGVCLPTVVTLCWLGQQAYDRWITRGRGGKTE